MGAHRSEGRSRDWLQQEATEHQVQSMVSNREHFIKSEATRILLFASNEDKLVFCKWRVIVCNPDSAVVFRVIFRYTHFGVTAL